jgi:predicted outer membrane protein
MSASIKPKALAFAAGICCLLVAYAVAQTYQPGQPTRTDQPGQPGRIDQPGQPPTMPTQRQSVQTSRPLQSGRNLNPEVEQYIVQCLLEKNQGEVEISQFAQQRSQNPEVKQFAQQLIQDHQQNVQKLQRLTGAQAGAGRTQGVQPAGFEAQANTSQPGIPQQPGGAVRAYDNSNRAGAPSSAIQQLTAIEKQIYEHCQQALQEKLQSKQGADFDHCYVGSQIAAHMQMLSALGVLENQTDGQLRQVIQESQPTVKQHLEHAEKLAEQLMNTSTRQAGAQPTTQRVPR